MCNFGLNTFIKYWLFFQKDKQNSNSPIFLKWSRLGLTETVFASNVYLKVQQTKGRERKNSSALLSSCVDILGRMSIDDARVCAG